MTTGYGRPDRQLGRRNFFSFVPALLFSISTLYLLAFLLCFFFLFQSYCSHAQVFWRTLAPEFRISYSHTEWYLHFLQGEILLTFAIVLLVRNKTIIIIVVYLNPPTGNKTPYQCKISKTFNEYLDFMHRLRKAT